MPRDEKYNIEEMESAGSEENDGEFRKLRKNDEYDISWWRVGES